MDQTSLSANLLSVTDDFTADGGTAGTASGGNFTDQFLVQTAPVLIPEPGATLPLGALLLAAAGALKRRAR
jgi:hypothetical protein